jgi:hypothetical protein
MIAIKASYQNGKITLLESLPKEIKKAKLTIVFETEEGEDNYVLSKEYQELPAASETEFKYLGLSGFFDTEDDNKINWEDYFGLK